jgi:poly-beta-1,6-N-acetyl-D-glucosamine synthase
MGHDLAYVLVTPARNEEAYIEQTIQSVITQTLPPLKWVIVSDGSTDNTDEIARKYLRDYPWIELVRMPEHRDRNFAAKVACFNAGYEQLRKIPYNIIGNLDADITFEHDYFEYLLEKFRTRPNLGVAGTPFVEGTFQYDYRYVNIEHVSGACQLFRRECFEDIDGYTPIRGGGIDWVAVTTARMKGWETRTFTDKTCTHHRKMGTGSNRLLKARFQDGTKDFYLGGHPLWELFRCAYQMKTKPYVLSGIALLCGYVWSFLTGVEKTIPQELIDFRRKEQMQRLKALFGVSGNGDR